MKKRLFLFVLILLALNTGLLSAVSADNVVVEADRQSFDPKTNTMNLDSNVKVRYENMVIKSPKAVVRANGNGEPASAEFFPNAYLVKQDQSTRSEVKANVFKLSLFEKNLKAEGNARSVVLENKKPLAIIRSKNQEFDFEDNTITATGNVSIIYNDISTKSSSANIRIDESGKPSMVKLIGNAQMVQGNNIINAATLTLNPTTNALDAVGNAISSTVLDDSSKVVVRSDYQQFDKTSNTLITGGNVRINYKDYIATGPKASFVSDTPNAKPNRIIFIGRSTIKQGARVIEANKITITTSPKNFLAEGNVKTRFSQFKSLEKQEKTKNKNRKKSSPKRTEAVNNTKTGSEDESYLDKLDKQAAQESVKSQELIEKK